MRGTADPFSRDFTASTLPGFLDLKKEWPYLLDLVLMDLPCVQWQDHVAQKWTSLDPARKQCFTSLLEIDDVFQFGLTHTNQEDLDLLSSISKAHFIQKDPEQAARCRERGNSSFKTRDYTGAAMHYSQGVCFAPQSSEQLSLCYANRSAALCHLQCYQESLDDIDRALAFGYPSHLQHKLQDRRAQCLNHLSSGQRGKPDRPEPNSGDKRGTGDGTNVKPANESIHNGIYQPSGISPGVAVSFSPEKGRHLVATERITPGQVILEDRPYIYVLIPWTEEMRKNERRTETKQMGLFGTEDRHCHKCLRETLCPVPCDGCSYSRYCSSECRQEAWEEHHRWECPLGAPLMALGVMSQLALRVALKAGLKDVQSAREPAKDGDSSHKPVTEPGTGCSITGTLNASVNIQPSSMHYGDSYASIYHLLHHLNTHSPTLRFLCAITAAVLYMKLSGAGPPPVSWDLRGSPVTNSQSQGPEAEEESTGWSPELWLLGSVVLRHLLQLRCNAQAISMLQDTGVTNSAVQSSQEIRIATAIFPTLSLLNHSCSPNTSLAFSLGACVPGLSHSVGSGPDASSCPSERKDKYSSGARGVTITVRASRDIAPGQEILHCYGPHSNRMAMCERQRLLQEQYYFLCACEACAQRQEELEDKPGGSRRGSGAPGRPGGSGLQCGKCKGPLEKRDVQEAVRYICARSSCGQHISAPEVSRRLQEVREQLEKAVNLMERDRPDEALRLLQRTTASQSGLILAESHPLQGEVADAMARAHATMGDWNSAASQLERSAVAIHSQYGEDSIEMGRQLFKLAQLHFNGGALGAALSVIPRARKLLCLHCGPQCPELHELQAMEDCLPG